MPWSVSGFGPASVPEAHISVTLRLPLRRLIYDLWSQMRIPYEFRNAKLTSQRAMVVLVPCKRYVVANTHAYYFEC